MWGFKVAVVAQQWRDCQKHQRGQLTIGPSPPQHDMPHVPAHAGGTLPPASGPPVSAPVAYHHSVRRDDPSGQSQAPYSHPQISESDRSAHTYAQGARNQLQHAPASQPRDANANPSRNLPSLKASGLLDSWKPPSDTFASSLSISASVQSNASRDEERRQPPAVPFHIHGSGSGLQGHMHAHAHAHSHTHSALARANVSASNVAMPVGLTWLQRETT